MLNKIQQLATIDCKNDFDFKFKGLMIGVEFVESKDTRAPMSTEKFQQIWNSTKELGALFGCGGLYGNVRYFKVRFT